MNSNRDSCFTFGEGIEYVLSALSFPDNTKATFNADAQIIENTVVNAMASYDPLFRTAFKGLSLGGSYLDGIRIGLPDEFDMHVKTELNCSLTPVSARPGFIFLRADGKDHHCIKHVDGEGFFVDRLAVQSWFRDNITAVMPKLQNIRCSDGRAYSMEYTAHGYGVAHTMLATEHRNHRRQISFDFVPVFVFEPNQWPRDQRKYPKGNREWFAVPRKYFDKPEAQDPRSFILCAPFWERLVLHKKQNLKDSLRLMKALRNANEMSGLVSYHLKSIYLNAADEKLVTWNQAPGRILIRMMVNLLHAVRLNNLPFYLAPDHNNLDKLSEKQRQEYVRILNKIVNKLIRRRDANYLTGEDLYQLFGVEVK
ncbi:cyclic GMP-AMP synthase-like receptor [Drosophila albomicans]|uniref:Cyclic GMP-AMP synthase-like receptor n=2 Tax=nasuta subgroup TaxID=32307 RepID=A0A6P8X5Z2_DROAB|nr:cyclic GMP-AMP synthase-like receptor [Drosophila albomicans]